MVIIESVKIEGKVFQFVNMQLGMAPLLILKGDVGYVMCGYLSLETSEKLEDTAVRVTGVKDLESLLDARVSGMTSKAAALGIEVNDKVSEIVKLL